MLKMLKKNNAIILENRKVIKVERLNDHWKIILQDGKIIAAKILINATGPWINDVFKDVIQIQTKKKN